MTYAPPAQPLRSEARRSAPGSSIQSSTLRPSSAARTPVVVISPGALAPPPRPRPTSVCGALRTLLLRWLGPPQVDPQVGARDFGVFRALYEIGSDYLPSSGTWPSSRAP